MGKERCRDSPHTKDHQSLLPILASRDGTGACRCLLCELWHWLEQVQSHLRGTKSRSPLLKPTGEVWLSQRKWHVPRQQLHLTPQLVVISHTEPMQNSSPPSWCCFCPCLVAQPWAKPFCSPSLVLFRSCPHLCHEVGWDSSPDLPWGPSTWGRAN